MNNRPIVMAFFRRFLILLGVSIILVFSFSEIAYRLMKDPTSRPPGTVELVIPNGTATRIAAGETPPGIPTDMVFIIGDTLLVKNEDSQAHQLDVLFIPPGSSASMKLGEANDYAFACSFQPSRYVNLTVRQATTWVTRLAALWYGVPVTVMFLLTYSFIFWPLKPTNAPSTQP
jgi:hypothetical protein